MGPEELRAVCTLCHRIDRNFHVEWKNAYLGEEFGLGFSDVMALAMRDEIVDQAAN